VGLRLGAVAASKMRVREIAPQRGLCACARRGVLSGVSGTGVVAYGTQYPPSGLVTLAWLGHTTGHHSLGVYQSLAAVEAIHGHHGYTEIIWLTPAHG